MEMFKKLISLEEKRVSTLMVGMLGTLIFCLLMYWRRGDISNNLVNILEALIAGVVGVTISNVINSIGSSYVRKEETDADTGEQSKV